jgi:cell division protein FtsW (lipid II flippase)
MQNEKNKLSISEHAMFLIVIASLNIVGFIAIFIAQVGFNKSHGFDPFYHIKIYTEYCLIGVLLFIIIQYVKVGVEQTDGEKLMVFVLLFSFLAYRVGIPSGGALRFIGSGASCIEVGRVVELLFFISVASYIGNSVERNNYKSIYYAFLCIGTIISLTFEPYRSLVVTISLTLMVFYLVLNANRGRATLLILSILFFCTFNFIRVSAMLKNPLEEGYQILRTFSAVKSGGYLGNGVTYTIDAGIYIPGQMDTFIFSKLSECFGLIGLIFFCLLFLSFLYFGVRAAAYAEHKARGIMCLLLTIRVLVHSALGAMTSVGIIIPNALGIPFMNYNRWDCWISFATAGFIYQQLRLKPGSLRTLCFKQNHIFAGFGIAFGVVLIRAIIIINGMAG